jgi:hypothetical protein
MTLRVETCRFINCHCQVDLPQRPLAEVVVVVDPHPGPFLRQLAAAAAESVADTKTTSKSHSSSSAGGSSSSSTSGGLPALLRQLQQLQELGWVDRVVVARAKGSEAVEVRPEWHLK